MRSINEYKRRFNTLLESKMGDVKPLISEAPQFEEFVVPTLDMVKGFKCMSNVEMKAEISLNGNEYKLTLPEGMYDSLESIGTTFSMDQILMITEEESDYGKKVGNASDKVSYATAEKYEYGGRFGANSAHVMVGDTYIFFRFEMPETQKELEENSPFIQYVDFRCKNVRGGKIRFSVEVPSGSEIYEKEKPVPTPTYNPDYDDSEDVWGEQGV